MKKVILTTLSLLMCTASFAEKVNLRIDNSSNRPIVVEKQNGTRIKIASQTSVYSVFEEYTIVKSYSLHNPNELLCTWFISSARERYRQIALTYTNNNGVSICGEIIWK